VGDFNGDGHLDLAVANSTAGSVSMGTVSIVLGNGDGSFRPGESYAVGIQESDSSAGGQHASLAISDFNGDGRLDIAVANPGAMPHYKGTVSILLGNGDGTFQPPLTFSAGFGPVAVAVGDFNGDGKQDLVTANLSYDIGRLNTYIWEDDVRVFLGNGDGTFQPGQAFGEAGNPVAVAFGDFNGDGIPDLALADQLQPQGVGSTVTILLGKGDGNFVNPQHFVVGGHPVSVAVGDFNSDGHLDLALADLVNPGAVTILLNAGAGGGNSSRPPK
jgi:hypothetical protein